MKTLTKFLSLILILAMCVPFLASCGKEEDPEETDVFVDPEIATYVDSKTKDANPNIEAVDYDGYEYTFISRLGNDYNCNFVVSEEETGDILGDAIFKRNAFLEEKYNITFKQTTTTDILSEVRRQVMSGSTEFDVIVASCTNLSVMAQENLLYDLNSIDRFNFEAPYWDSNACEQLSIGKKLYYTNCAMNMSTIGFVTFFNKKLVEDYKLTSPYEYMSNNEWTLDNWAKMVKSVSKDMDGDGKMTEFDQYGTLYEHHNPRMFLYGFGIRATENIEKGYPVPTLMKNEKKTVDAYEKLKAVFADTNVSYCMTCSPVEANGFEHKWAYLRNLFTQDLYMFHYSSSDDIKAFADMESEFGIVPFPKYDSNQEKYQTMYPVNHLLIAIPASSTGTKLEMTATVLEDFNYYSSIMTLPAWYEVLLKRRSTRDEESEQSIQILHDNCVYDVGLYYDFGNIRTQILDVDISSANISRNYARISKGIDASIKRVYTNYGT